MIKPKAKAVVPAPVQVQVEEPKDLKTKLQRIIPVFVLSRIKTIQVTDARSLAIADGFLGKLVEVRKEIKADFADIISPLEQALKKAKDLRKKWDDEYALLEGSVRGAMDDYRTEEHRRILKAEADRIAEETKRLQEAERKRIAAAQAKTPQMKARLEAQATQAEDAAVEVMAAPKLAPVQLAGSTTRVVERVRVTNLKLLLQGIIDGVIPEDVIITQESVLKRYHDSNPNLVKEWPGVEIYEDVSVMRLGKR